MIERLNCLGAGQPADIDSQDVGPGLDVTAGGHDRSQVEDEQARDHCCTDPPASRNARQPTRRGRAERRRALRGGFAELSNYECVQRTRGRGVVRIRGGWGLGVVWGHGAFRA